MHILITYDVETSSAAGRRRLRKVAKLCTDYGQRVQNSVFELNIYESDLLRIKNDLQEIIDPDRDNIRIYRLGKNWEHKIETLGQDHSYNPEKDLLIV